MLDAILFDLDGTLLPMDNDYFTKVYFSYLAKAAEKWGYTDKEKLIKGIWAGVSSMVKNNGEKLNVDAFWETFSVVLGRDCSDDIAKFDKFYENEFHNALSVTEEAPLAKRAVELAREKAKHVILATNPIFPRIATKSRLSWIGLTFEDFDFVTDYSNSSFCKPNPRYYEVFVEKFGLDPSNCLMVGNDVTEDFEAASSLGMSAFLITDHIINRENKEITCPCGSYADMVAYLENL